ncbi:MAG: PD-(D/E)XK nuclease family protein [Anaerolineaceae bacterium]|nr:PD-(D/E)XK nuclease family protein [Anaerolineaceae bacterium]
MPFNFFICEVTGECIEFDACIHCAKQGALPGCQMSPAILFGITQNQRPNGFSEEKSRKAWKGTATIDHAVSVTELLSCPRKKKLKDQVDWGDKPSSLYWAYRGNIFHGAAEDYAATDETVICEERFFWFFKFQGKIVALSGQPDLLIERDAGFHILDYKTIKQIPGKTYRHICTHTGAIMYDSPWRMKGKQANCKHCNTKHSVGEIEILQLPPQPRGSHIEQIQLYSLLTAQADKPAVSAEVVYMDMGSALRIPIPLWDRQDRIALLRKRLALVIQDDPDIVRNSDDLWQCDYCPVRTDCEYQQGGPVGKAILKSEAEAVIA